MNEIPMALGYKKSPRKGIVFLSIKRLDLDIIVVEHVFQHILNTALQGKG